METFQTDNYITVLCFRILAEPGKLYLVETKDTHPLTSDLSVINPKSPKKHTKKAKKKLSRYDKKQQLDGRRRSNDYAGKPL